MLGFVFRNEESLYLFRLQAGSFLGKQSTWNIYSPFVRLSFLRTPMERFFSFRFLWATTTTRIRKQEEPSVRADHKPSAPSLTLSRPGSRCRHPPLSTVICILPPFTSMICFLPSYKATMATVSSAAAASLRMVAHPPAGTSGADAQAQRPRMDRRNCWNTSPL